MFILSQFIKLLSLLFLNRYKNRPKMTFDDTGIPPDQEFELFEDTNGIHEYPIKYVYLVLMINFSCQGSNVINSQSTTKINQS